jgi:hypothetical protein
MRFLTMFSLLASLPLFGQSPDEKDVVAVVQKAFDGIAARDGAMIHSAMLPDARISFVRDEAAPGSVTVDELVTRISSTKGDLLERFTSRPSVLIRGRIAQVWGEYEFLHDGKLVHCGVDAVSLFKTPEGWKIATIVYTAETTGCKAN